MKKICVVTATRAEYGLLRNTILRIEKADDLELCLVVTGMHLDKRYGMTIKEIEEDGISIAQRIPILSEKNDEAGILETMAKATMEFGKYFGKAKPDMVIVLGDRYELFPICQSALIYGIPIAHISGGEITEGAIDDAVRNCVTQMSSLHFPGCEIYRQRIISMGRPADMVFNFGDVGIENIRQMDYMSKEQIADSIGFSLEQPYACVTFHPVTKEKGNAKKQIQEVLKALEYFSDMKFIITKANADTEGECINEEIDCFVEKHENCVAFHSLGIRRYLSALKYAEMVIGNSSSGIVEAPCFGIPTINIGNRQKGRLQAESILNCEPKAEDIIRTIEKARSAEFREMAQKAENPYGDGNTSEKIIETIRDYFAK